MSDDDLNECIVCEDKFAVSLLLRYRARRICDACAVGILTPTEMDALPESSEIWIMRGTTDG